MNVRAVGLALLLGSLVAVACDSEDGSKRRIVKDASTGDGSELPDAGLDAPPEADASEDAPAEAEAEAPPDANDCDAFPDGAGCGPSPCGADEHVRGGACVACERFCTRSAGDDPRAGDTSCACPPDATVSGAVNLSTDAVTSGRTCAEAKAYSLAALTRSAATVDGASIDPGCLAAGDDVLVINLQGAPGKVANVGAYEVLRVASLDASAVTFASPKTKFFGAGAADDAEIGVTAASQKVAMIRLPRFGTLTIEAGASLTAAPWDGLIGGVVAVEATELVVEGMIDARDLGYRGGRSSFDGYCWDGVDAEAGESIGGMGTISPDANYGGPGGIPRWGPRNFNDNDPLMPSAGHAAAGEVGQNFRGEAMPYPGLAYGVGDGSKLTLGSGSGGTVRCAQDASPAHLGDETSRLQTGGGVLALFTGTLEVRAGGALDATPSGTMRGAASAGYVFIDGHTVTFEDGAVRAAKVRGEAHDTNGGRTYVNYASEGFVAIFYRTTQAGVSDPPAFTRKLTAP